jgi:hypothetical protein
MNYDPSEFIIWGRDRDRERPVFQALSDWWPVHQFLDENFDSEEPNYLLLESGPDTERGLQGVGPGLMSAVNSKQLACLRELRWCAQAMSSAQEEHSQGWDDEWETLPLSKGSFLELQKHISVTHCQNTYACCVANVHILTSLCLSPFLLMRKGDRKKNFF